MTLIYIARNLRQLKISQFKSLIVALVVNKIVFLKYLFVIKFITENGIQLNYNLQGIFCNWSKDVDCEDRPICDGNDGNCQDDSVSTPKPKEPPEAMGKCSSMKQTHFNHKALATHAIVNVLINDTGNSAALPVLCLTLGSTHVIGSLKH